MAIKLNSNLKIITSGSVPTTDNLMIGEAAFGYIPDSGDTGGKYHLFCNPGDKDFTGNPEDNIGKIIDLIIPIEVVQTMGTSVSSVMSQNAVSILIQAIQAVLNKIWDSTEPDEGELVDNGYAVLSSDPQRVYAAAQITQFLEVLGVYTKEEVDAKLVSVFKPMGSVDTFQDLLDSVDDDSYVPVSGHVWNIKAVGGTDVHGDIIKAGGNVVYIEDVGGLTGWDQLGGTVDLTGYLTNTEFDAIILGTGDGTKVLTDDRTYQTIELNIVEI
jgi:hypothetical protein